MKFAFTFLFTCFSTILIAQTTTNSATIKKSLEKKSQMIQTSLVKNIAFTNIGPTVMSGRVADIASGDAKMRPVIAVLGEGVLDKRKPQ